MKEKVIPLESSEPSESKHQDHSPLNKSNSKENRSTAIVLQDFKNDIANKRNLNVSEGPSNSNSVRVLIPDGDFQFVIDTKSTLAVVLLGEKIGNKIMNLYFMKSNLSKLVIITVELVWWFTSVILYVFIFGVISLDFRTVLILEVLNSIKGILGLLVCNMGIIRLLLRNFETLFLFIIMFVFIISSVVLFSGDAKFLFFLSWIPQISWMILFDSYIQRGKRAAIWIGVIAGLGIISLYAVGLTFKLIAIDDVVYNFGGFSMTLTEIVIHSAFTLGLFVIKNILNYFMFPNCLSVISCKLKNVLIEKNAAQVLVEVENYDATEYSNEEEQSIRILKPIAHLVEPVVTGETLGFLCCGKKFADLIFRLGRSSFFINLTVICWLLGGIFNLLSFCDIYSQITAPLVMLGFPTNLITVSIFSSKISSKVFFTFQTMYSTYNVLIFTIAVIFLYSETPIISIAALFGAPSYLMVLYFDSYPGGKGRRRTLILTFCLNIVFLFGTWLIVFLKIAKTTDFTLRLGYTSITASGSAFHAISNLVVFGLKNLFHAFWSPDCLVVVTSKVENIKVSNSLKTQLKAADLLRKEQEVIINKNKNETYNSSSRKILE